MNIRIGHISKILSPGYSYCQKCNTTWKFVKPHTTWYIKTEKSDTGCFALCEKCWNELSPEQRFVYYEMMMYRWSGFSNWKKIKEAVLKGL